MKKVTIFKPSIISSSEIAMIYELCEAYPSVNVPTISNRIFSLMGSFSVSQAGNEIDILYGDSTVATINF